MRNLKKVISSVAAMALVASSASAFAVTFPDVDASASYANAVDALVALKVVRGDDKGLFNPDNNVTRAEFTTMAVGALNETAAAQAQTTSEFTDAANTQQHWAAGYIAQGVADGFINGMGDGRFAPDEQVTFAQAAKMLVAAVGYTSYAEAAGGWPSGYVSQASTLGISKGVSATNDTALTRAQCAIMVYNAMQVPLCVIDEWETQVTLTGTVQTPKLKKLDGKEQRDYQTLLTDKHDAYVVKGRVMVNYQGDPDALKKDEVKYNVEVSDNYDDELDIKKGKIKENQTFKVGATDAANMLFAYTEAIVQKDEDNDEFTIISITNYGNAKIVEFAADDVADDDTTIGTHYIDPYEVKNNDNTTTTVENYKLPVYKGSNTSSTTKYELSKYKADSTEKVKIYVNGKDAGEATDQKIKDYILANPTGYVKLVDKTDVGSTSTDGKYDYIMVDFYVDAVVDDVTTTSAYARVDFKESQIEAMRMEWDPEDSDIEVKFTLDGAEIAYTDLQENDVLSIKYNIVDKSNKSDALKDNKYYDVLVSRNVVEGDVTSRDTTDQTVTVAGTEYDLVYNDQKYSTKTNTMTEASKFELGTEYKLYLDAFGYVAYKDEGSSDKNYGVIVAMFQGSGDDNLSVRLITSDAKVVSYECKDGNEAKRFYNYAKSHNPDGDEEAKVFKKDDGYHPANTEKGTPESWDDGSINKNIIEGKTVCTYKLSGGKIRFDSAYPKSGSVAGGTEQEFKTRASKLGNYSISDASTKIIDMDDYMNGSDTTVKTLSLSDFEDEAKYTAYFYDRNSSSVYRFAIVLYGTSSIRPESQLAVVKKANGTTDVDGNRCYSYTVYRGGNEVEVYVDDTTTQLKEGAVFTYKLNSDGYVDPKDLRKLYEPKEDSYDEARDAILANDLFAKALTPAYMDTTGNFDEPVLTFGETKSSKDVYAYAGIVYTKSGDNLELFIRQNSGVSSTLTDTKDFTLNGANVYVYDFNYQKDKGARVNVASVSQSDSKFNGTFDDADETIVNWSKVDEKDKNPLLAFVKEVDGDVTDCLFIQSN